MTIVSRRAFLTYTAVSAGVSLLAACGGAAAPATSPTQGAAATPAAPAAQPTVALAAAAQATISPAAASKGGSKLVWWTNDGAQGKRIVPVYQEFMKANGQIQVEDLVIPGDLALKLAPAAAAKTLPDIFYARTFTTADYALKGWLYDINDLVQRDAKEINLDDLDPLMTVKEKWAGKWYSLPENFSDIVVYYNKKLFDAAKVPYPKDAWTWDEFLATAKLFVRSDAGKQTQFGTDFFLSNWVTWGHMLGNGGQVLTPDLKKSMVNSKENVDTLQFFADLINVHKVAPAPNQLPKGMDPFGNSLVAMHVGGSWEIARLRDEVKSKFDWDVAAIPVGKTGKYGVNVEGGCYGIGGSTKYPEDAWKLLKFSTTTSAIATEVDKLLFSLPGRLSNREDWVKVAQTDKLPPAHAPVFFDILKNTTPEVPALPYYTEFSRAFDNRVAGIVSGERKAADVLPQLDEELNKVIADTQF